MRSTPADLLVVSPDPTAALRSIGDGARNVTVTHDVTTLGAVTATDATVAVLLSGDVAPDVVARLADTLGDRPLTIAVDLQSPPRTAALAALASCFHDTFTFWGDLPVALVETSGARPVDPSLLAELAPLLAPADRAGAALATAALADADADRTRLEARVAELDDQLRAQRARLGKISRERDDAVRRMRDLGAHPGVRLWTAAAAIARRVPAGRLGLLLLVALGAAVAIVPGIMIAVRGDVALGVALALLALGVSATLGATAVAAVLALRQDSRTVATLATLDRVAQGQRRVETDVHVVRREVERTTRVSRERHVKVAERFRNINRAITRQQRLRTADLRDHLAQTQASLRLFTSIPVTASVPPMGGWAASADLVGLLVDEFLDRRPSLVVECGSGVSTLWLALAARQHDVPTRIVALDHDAHYAAQTRALLRRHGVDHLADVRHAPLRMTDVGGQDRLWYHTSALENLDDIGLLFVDGPPAATGVLARHPAVPLLADHFAPRCSIVLDDMQREDDQAVARGWQDLLADFERTDVPLEKGATVFRRG